MAGFRGLRLQTQVRPPLWSRSKNFSLPKKGFILRSHEENHREKLMGSRDHGNWVQPSSKNSKSRMNLKK